MGPILTTSTDVLNSVSLNAYIAFEPEEGSDLHMELERLKHVPICRVPAVITSIEGMHSVKICYYFKDVGSGTTTVVVRKIYRKQGGNP